VLLCTTYFVDEGSTEKEVDAGDHEEDDVAQSHLKADVTSLNRPLQIVTPGTEIYMQ
jgi:hypothetical protein